MSNRALLLAVAACFATAACDAKKDQPPQPKAAQAVVPLPPAAPTAPAASSAQDAKPLQVADTSKAGAAPANYPGVPYKNGKRGGCGKDKCKVSIDIDGDKCTATYNAEYLSVYAKTVEITFHLKGGWKFLKDGIELPVGGNQFSTGSGAGSNKWTIQDQNSDDRPYKYTINAEKNGRKCKVDPSVVNGADYDDPNYPQFP